MDHIKSDLHFQRFKLNPRTPPPLLLQAFTASSILRTHIRQHSGERPFKCKHCGKAFASHAAHDSHVRRTHARDKPPPCDLCGAAFQEDLQLQYHMKSHKSETVQSSFPSLF